MSDKLKAICPVCHAPVPSGMAHYGGMGEWLCNLPKASEE